MGEDADHEYELAEDQMIRREVDLMAGHMEELCMLTAGTLYLYWEPIYQLHEGPVHAFTVDFTDVRGGVKDRWRFATLAEADAKWQELIDKHALAVAKAALRLN